MSDKRLHAGAMVLLAVIALTAMAGGPAAARPGDQPVATTAVPSAPKGESLALPRDGGGSLGSLTVEGTSQVRIHFERPALKLDLDPMAAPGLQSGSALDILERRPPDLALPLLAHSVQQRAERTPRPWLTGFTVGALTRLRPDLKGVQRWQLEIVDARGTVVSTQAGEGSPPRELAWDGLDSAGEPAPCGLTYTHVLTARDKAGNTRRFVGDSFQLPAYRVDAAHGPCLLFSAAQWRGASADGPGVSPLLIEAATVLNLHTDPGRALVVTATAATLDEADGIGREVIEALAPRVGGGDQRMQLRTLVRAGSPAGGTVRVAAQASD